MSTPIILSPETLVWAAPLPDEPTRAAQEAILRTVAYADVFNYPLTRVELQRYLIGVSADLQTVSSLLSAAELVRRHIHATGEFFHLRGREELVEVRRQRAQTAARLWPRARRYGRIIAGLPFVRMVAVTGSLAVSNPVQGGDIDFMLATAPGRVWLCRALVIVLVRWADRLGDRLCPNYVVSSRALASERPDLYTAHELAQMVPLAGLEVYVRLRRLNAWTFDYLPNARGAPPGEKPLVVPRFNPLGSGVEIGLSGFVGSSLESWEMRRKVKRFARQFAGAPEAAFCADWCKGYVDGHAGRTRQAYTERLERLGLSVDMDSR